MLYRNFLFLNEIRVSDIVAMRGARILARVLFGQASVRVAIIGLVSIGSTLVYSQKPDVSDSTIARSAQAALDEVVTDSGPGVAVLIARGEKVIYRSARPLPRTNVEPDR